MSIPRAPAGAGPSGRRLWREIQADYELSEHETALLTALVRQVDRLDKLEELIAAEGLTVDASHGVKMHPAVPEARASAIAIARISAALRLPAGETGDDARPAASQRRTGVRGIYSIRGGAG
jgi:hypothetical protein